MYSVLTLQWTIFGLSVTIFLVWEALIGKFLKDNQPNITGEDDGLQEYRLLLKKQAFTEEVETTFSSVTLLTINLFSLLFATSLVYVQNHPEMIFAQNMVLFSFNISLGTIAILFIDILKPLKRDKAALLKENIVTKEDIDHALTYGILRAVVDGTIEAIIGSNEYSEDEKRRKVEACMEALKKVTDKNYPTE